MAGRDLMVEGIGVTELFTKMQDKGVSAADAQMLVGTLILANAGKLRRVFNYATAFPAEDAACKPQFVRSFAHADWVDGESVVQAEQTTGEEGFNLRFHRIETDIDALATDLGVAFACLTAMRSSLRSLLDEIRTELNRLNSLVGDRSPIGPFLPLPPKVELLGRTKVANADMFIMRDGEEFKLIKLEEFAGGGVKPVGPRPEWLTGVPHDKVINMAADITKSINANAELLAAIRGGSTAGELAESFGDVPVATSPAGEEIALKDVLIDMPADVSFGSAVDPSAAIAERILHDLPSEETDLIRNVALTEAGRGRAADTLPGAAVTELTAVTPALARSLEGAGVGTIDELARLSVPDAMEALRRSGAVRVNETSVTRAVIAARFARGPGGSG